MKECIHETEIAIMKDHLESIKYSVDKMTKVMLEGNGRPSLMSRMDKVERHSDHIPEILTEMNQNKGTLKGFKLIGGLLGVVLVVLQILQFIK